MRCWDPFCPPAAASSPLADWQRGRVFRSLISDTGLEGLLHAPQSPSEISLRPQSFPCGFSFLLSNTGVGHRGGAGWRACRWRATDAGVGTTPERWVQCSSHAAALPSAAPEVENAITLQKSQNMLEGEGEKKTMVKKMMVREPPLVCGIGVGAAEVLSLPTDEMGGCGGEDG